MPVVEHDVALAAPPEVVFDHLSDPANLRRWDTSVVAAEQLEPGPLAVGTHWRGTTRVLGRRFDWTAETTELTRPWRMTSRSVAGPLGFTLSYDLRPAAGGTRLRYRMETGSGLGGLFGRLADPVVQRAQSRIVRANLERLAEQLAAEAAA